MAEYNYINSTGVIVPDTADIRQQVESEYRAVFGQDINLSPETPQGVLVTMEVESRDAIARNNAEVANQINPNIAGGIFLDGIWALMGGARFGATHSILTGVVFSGIPKTLIKAGSIAETDNGDKFITTAVIILGADGTAIGSMRALEFGAVICPAGALNKVASDILGWETVSNPADAVVGRLTESDVSARRRRIRTLAINTVSVNAAITSALYALEDVVSLSFHENYTDDPQTVDGITLKPHSIYVCIEGGDDMAIAKELLRTKTVGAGYNGNVIVEVEDKISGQTYEVNFDRPDIIVTLCRVTVRRSTLDAQTIIPNAVEMFTAGEIDGEGGLEVGREVSPFEISAAINSVEPRLFVTKVELSTDSENWSTDVIPIKINQVAKLNKSAVQVLIV
ncbi:MAG: baseplate J/gp47 family protein [Enterobacteriaceae bacterium]|jgi:uncharacterized phage protein gp47/JayE|nr:baseplate J/gp47 family protein [Enterobacteriaceae bacterium]